MSIYYARLSTGYVLRVCGVHRRNLGQGTQRKDASVASRWHIVLIQPT